MFLHSREWIKTFAFPALYFVEIVTEIQENYMSCPTEKSLSLLILAVILVHDC